jgi:dipeptidyl aminopeptidase/acylaminoacyl peptidase
MSPRFIGIALLFILSTPVVGQESAKSASAIDLLSWKDILTVELSPDGRQVIYTTKEPDWNQNRFAKAIWVQSTDGQGRPVPLAAPDKDDNPRFPGDYGDAPRWSPDGSKIAFLSVREGPPQVWTIDKPGGKPEKLTNAPGGVISFSWAPDSRHLAFIARSAKKGSFEAGRQADKDAGIVINKWDFVIYKLLNNSGFLQLDQMNELWMVDLASKNSEALINNVHVSQFAWAPDSRRLAVIFQTTPGLANQRTDVLIYSLADKKSDVILQGTGGEFYDDTSGYSNPMWSPDGSALALFYRQLAQRWQAKSLLGLYRFADKKFTQVPGADRWVLYSPRLLWHDANHMWLENTLQAARHLYSIDLRDGKVIPVGEHSGSESMHSFSSDGSTVVFIRQSNTQAPELFIAHAPFASSSKITSVNTPFESTAAPKFERTHWKSKDGMEVEGWLAKPPAFDSQRKYPLLVMVHGGPGFAVPDAFEMYPEWPYPYRMAAMRGYLVLIPNYRGTGSYSEAFSNPRALEAEPVDDVVSGVEYLVAQGFVDQQRIGITGHSHGGWLGAQVMVTHPKMFRAASFAEGGLDLMSAYGQMPGWLNLNIHDYYQGGPPYADPLRYIATSPIFHVVGLTTPTLLEFGDQSLAAQGLEFESALWRCGVPSELIFYPKTGHNMARPAQEAEAMQRNLDWFDYWMFQKENSSAGSSDQYARWKQLQPSADRMMRSHPCARVQSR